MGVFKDIREAREYFRGDRFAMDCGVVLRDLGDGWSECGMALDGRYRDARDNVTGGAIFTLADLAFAAAANHRHSPTVTQSVSVHYLRATRGSRLTARAVCVSDGERSCVYDIAVTDDLGEEIARIVETGFKV